MAEITFEENLLELGIRLEHHLDDLGFTIGIGSEIEHTASYTPLGQVVFPVTHDAGHIEALDI